VTLRALVDMGAAEGPRNHLGTALGAGEGVHDPTVLPRDRVV
jgi:hypothetical protein